MTARETERRADYYCGLFKTTERKSMHSYRAPGATFAGFKLGPESGERLAVVSFEPETSHFSQRTVARVYRETTTMQRWFGVTKGGGRV